MKNNKKLLCVLFSVLVVQGAVGAILATDGILRGDGEISHEVEVKSVYERLTEIEESDEYTDKQKELLKEKLLAKINASSERASDYEYILDVPFCKQETDYYCAAATTRQTLLFYGVSNVPSQSEIANDLGITAEIGLPDASYMIKYINSYIPDEPEYAEEHPEDEEDMILSFKTACKNYGPPIIRINTEENKKWEYSAKGHFLNVSGIKKSGNECTITLTDPYITWKTNDYPDGTYPMSSSEVYDVIMEHWFKGYWW